MPKLTWADIARQCPRLEGKRLSEVASLVLGGDAAGATLPPADYYIAAKALAAGYLDITGIDRKGNSP